MLICVNQVKVGLSDCQKKRLGLKLEFVFDLAKMQIASQQTLLSYPLRMRWTLQEEEEKAQKSVRKTS